MIGPSAQRVPRPMRCGGPMVPHEGSAIRLPDTGDEKQGANASFHFNVLARLSLGHNRDRVFVCVVVSTAAAELLCMLGAAQSYGSDHAIPAAR